jgi:hypothetical protein
VRRRTPCGQAPQSTPSASGSSADRFLESGLPPVMASFQDGRQGRPRLRPARGTAIKVQTIITSTFAGLVTGAALMYVLDSEGGRRRRAVARDKVTSKLRRLRRAAEAKARGPAKPHRGHDCGIVAGAPHWGAICRTGCAPKAVIRAFLRATPRSKVASAHPVAPDEEAAGFVAQPQRCVAVFPSSSGAPSSARRVARGDRVRHQ